jgi:hypothetical protein
MKTAEQYGLSRMVADDGVSDGLVPFFSQKQPKLVSDRTNLKTDLVESGMELVWLVTEAPKSVAEVSESVAEVPKSVTEVPESVAEVPEFVAEVPEFVAEVGSFETDVVRKTVKSHRWAVKCSKIRQFRPEFV